MFNLEKRVLKGDLTAVYNFRVAGSRNRGADHFCLVYGDGP